MTQQDDGVSRREASEATEACREVALCIQVSADWPAGTTETPPPVGRASAAQVAPVSCLFLKSSALSSLYDLEKSNGDDMTLPMTDKGTGHFGCSA